MTWTLDEKTFHSRLLLGTALYPSPEIMCQSIKASGTEIVTVSLRRESAYGNKAKKSSGFWDVIKGLNCQVLPNTAGCYRAKDAITTAELAREIFATDWIKLEVIGDAYNLQPDPFELITATKALIARGFKVFPYCTDDLVLCQRLVDCGCDILMPWGAPIGTGLGLVNPHGLFTLRQRLENVTLIVDAGIGRPSHAAEVLEMGFDGVLLNSAVALASDPVTMACAFKQGVLSGRQAFEAGIMPTRNTAQPSTPLVDTPFWLQKNAGSRN